MSETAISVEDLSKLYRLGAAEQRHESLVGATFSMLQSPIRNLRNLARLDTRRAAAGGDEAEELIWALRDVSFEVRRGEVLGIIGRNGAGKSTLLKILSRVAEPTAGRIVMDGQISSLLEVGTGFHPELTGRENVYLNGTILGMTRREIDRKFGEIAAFSGVQRFLDTPVKRYSSGMKVRLAFAVAAHLEPEILIVDEVLAVGDYEFQRKCLGKMQDVARGGLGRTVLFVSHQLGMIRSLCDRVLVLDGGRVAFDGPVERGIDYYHEQFARSAGEGMAAVDEAPDQPLQIREVAILDAEGQPAADIGLFEPATLRVRYRVREPLRGINLCFGLTYRGTKLLGSFDTDADRGLFEHRAAGEYEAHVELPTEILKPGTYAVTLSYGICNRATIRQLDGLVVFHVRESEDLSLKSYAPNRSFLVATRAGWSTRRLEAAVAR